MPNCCQGATCACKVSTEAGGHIVVTGSGTAHDPFVISADIALGVADNPQFDLTLSGTGTVADPWIIGVGYASTAKLGNVPDVNAPAPTNGQVLGWDTATSKWVAQPPTTAAPGAISHGTSLSGDGSVGSPLLVVPNAARLIGTSASGVGLSDAGMGAVVQHFATSAARSSMSPAPVLNSLTMLDTAPGRVDYWTGSAWAPLVSDVIQVPLSAAILELSGPYVAGAQLSHLMKHVTATTNASGVFALLNTTDLAGRAGVIQATVQGLINAGGQKYVYAVSSGLGGFAGQVVATAYFPQSGELAVSSPVNVTVDAYTY